PRASAQSAAGSGHVGGYRPRSAGPRALARDRPRERRERNAARAGSERLLRRRLEPRTRAVRAYAALGPRRRGPPRQRGGAEDARRLGADAPSLARRLRLLEAGYGDGERGRRRRSARRAQRGDAAEMGGARQRSDDAVRRGIAPQPQVTHHRRMIAFSKVGKQYGKQVLFVDASF